MDKAAAEPSLPLTVQAPSADVRRQVSPAKPLLRGWLHLDWFETWRRRLQRLDHAMIFLLIAGTATPAFLLATRGVFRISCLIVVWALTLTAGAIHMAWMGAPEPLVGSTFVGLGWVGGLALPGVWLHSGVAAGALMLAGGLLYTAGSLSYRRRRPDPYPSVFGYHEVFHVFVCAAATCQYIAIAWFIA